MRKKLLLKIILPISALIVLFCLSRSVLFAVGTITDSYTDTTKVASSGSLNFDTANGQVKLAFDTSFSCGSSFTDSRDSKSYDTVLVGSGCWMAENLNVGTRIDTSESQGTSCSSINKYCNSDTESNCTTYGGLYTWNQAMCNSTDEEVKGICPSGWHIPDHDEWTDLERAVCDTATCATAFPYDTSTLGFRGTDEGIQMKSGGSSGFEGLFGGRRISNGAFLDFTSIGWFWSSTQDSSNAWVRKLHSSDDRIERNRGGKVNSYSVRCIREAFTTSGSFISTNLLSGQSVESISTFTYDVASLATGTTLQVQFSQDGSTWVDSSGTANGSESLSTGTGEISLSALSWTSANFYYQMSFTTTDSSYSPVVNSVSVTFKEASDPPELSNISPEWGSTITGATVSMTFSLDETGDCRASIDDESYDDMSDDVDCTGDGTQSIACSVTRGLDGPEVVYVACRDTAGNKDTAATNEHVNYMSITSMTTLPVIPGEAINLYGMGTPAGGGRHTIGSSLTSAITNSIVASWDFDNQTLADNTYSSITCSLTGGASLVARGGGYALDLTGTGDNANCSNSGGYMTAGSDFTASAWVYTDTVGGDVLSSTDGSDYWEMRYSTGFSKWAGEISSSSGSQTSNWDYIAHQDTGRWRHMVVTYRQDTGKYYFYLNGTYIVTGFNGVDYLSASASENLLIGDDMDGRVDDVMLFNRALTEEEIRVLHGTQTTSYFDDHMDVYTVTNLSNSGAGSLREGIDAQERARTIIFEVSGNISLLSKLTIDNNNSFLTIAGQTAPSPGITLENYGLEIDDSAHDILIQHLRVRPGATSIGGTLTGWTVASGSVYSLSHYAEPDTVYSTCGSVWYNSTQICEDDGQTTSLGSNEWDYDSGSGTLYVNVGEDPDTGTLQWGNGKSAISDPLTTSEESYNIIIDHNSFTWGGDMTIQNSSNNATYIDNIMSEALGSTLHPKGAHSKGFYTLSYNSGETGGHYVALLRNLISHSVDRNPTISAGFAVIVNNLMYDLGSIAAIAIDDHALTKGPIKASVVGNRIIHSSRASPTPIQILSGTADERRSRFYLSSDNKLGSTPIVDPWNSDDVSERHPWPTLASIPSYKQAATKEDAIWPTSFTAMSVDEVKSYVESNVGAWPTSRDSTDSRIINNVNVGTGHIVTSQDAVGGWIPLAQNSHSLSVPASPDTIQTSGYTALEEWLHSFTVTVEPPTLATSSPAVNSGSVAVDANLVLSFSEAVFPGTGSIVIKSLADDSTVETITANSAQVTGSGTKTITINPSVYLQALSGYYLTIDAMAFDGSVADAYPGISSSGALNFTIASGGVLTLAASRGATLRDDATVNVASTGMSGVRNLRMSHSGSRVVDLTFNFSTGDRDFSSLTVERDDTIQSSVVHGLASQTGMSGTYTMYLEKNSGHDRVRVCPSKTTIGCTSSDSWKFVADADGNITETSGGYDTSGITVSVVSDEWVITGLSGTSAQGEASSSSSSTSTSQTTQSSGGGGRRGGTASMSNRIADAEAYLISRREGRLKARQAIVQDQAGAGIHAAAQRYSRLIALIDGQEILFRDVEKGAWYEPYVVAMINNNIAQGYRNADGTPMGKFGVDNPITHAEVLKMALEAAGKPAIQEPGVKNRFARGTWAEAYVAKAEALNLSLFTPTLNVHSPATRGEVIQTILEVMNIAIGSTLGSYDDLPATHPYAQAIGTATAHGLIQGDTDRKGEPTGKVRPDDLINRAEVAKIITILLETIQQEAESGPELPPELL